MGNKIVEVCSTCHFGPCFAYLLPQQGGFTKICSHRFIQLHWVRCASVKLGSVHITCMCSCHVGLVLVLTLTASVLRYWQEAG